MNAPLFEKHRAPRNRTITLTQSQRDTLATLMFFGLGYGLDRWVGTSPLFTIVFAVLAIVGKSVAMWYQYEATMRGLEAQRLTDSLGRQAPSAAADIVVASTFGDVS